MYPEHPVIATVFIEQPPDTVRKEILKLPVRSKIQTHFLKQVNIKTDDNPFSRAFATKISIGCALGYASWRQVNKTKNTAVRKGG